MLVEQISIFLENKSGRLAEVAKVLGDQKINIRALTIADTTDFGVLRLIVDQPAQAEKILSAREFTVRTTKVIAVEIPDQPSGLVATLGALEEAHVDIEYMYAYASKPGEKAIVIIKIADCERAIDALTNKNIRILTAQEVYESQPNQPCAQSDND